MIGWKRGLLLGVNEWQISDGYWKVQRWRGGVWGGVTESGAVLQCNLCYRLIHVKTPLISCGKPSLGLSCVEFVQSVYQEDVITDQWLYAAATTWDDVLSEVSADGDCWSSMKWRTAGSLLQWGRDSFSLSSCTPCSYQYFSWSAAACSCSHSIQLSSRAFILQLCSKETHTHPERRPPLVSPVGFGEILWWKQEVGSFRCCFLVQSLSDALFFFKCDDWVRRILHRLGTDCTLRRKASRRASPALSAGASASLSPQRGSPLAKPLISKPFPQHLICVVKGCKRFSFSNFLPEWSDLVRALFPVAF